MPKILWEIWTSLGTSLRGTSKEAPFLLVYCIEVVISMEVKVPNPKLSLKEGQNTIEKVVDLILSNERWDQALIRVKEYK